MIRREVQPGSILHYDIPLEVSSGWKTETHTVHVEIYVEKIEDGKVTLIWGSPTVVKDK